MATATAQAVQLLNLAYFGRPADPASLTAWQAAGMTQSQVVEVFVGTSEYTTNTVTPNSTESGGVRTYNMTNFINTLYNRLVGRDAAASEISGWSDAVSSGAVNHDYLGITLVNAILNLDESVEMRKVMIAKLDSANLYSDYLATDAADLSAYSTTAGLASGRAFNDSVTTTTAKTYAEVAAVAGLLDNPTKYTITSASATAGEGDDITFTVTLDSAPTEAVTVSYVTGNGSTDSSDFTAASGTITFAAGQTSQIVTVKTTEDSSFEEDETFTITFSGTRLNASVQAVGTITNDDANPNSVVQAFTLTTGIDTFTGLNGDDTFDATVDGTLTTYDTLVGGSGTDTLTATLSADNVVLNTSGIENVSLQNTGTSTINLENGSDITSVKVANSVATQTLTLKNIQTAVTEFTLSNLVDIDDTGGDTHHNLVLNFDDVALSSTSDDINITLDDASDVSISLTRDGASTKAVETVSFHSISEANVVKHFTSNAVDVATVEITGDQSITFDAALESEVLTVSGGTATGAISLTAAGGDNGVSITTGSGADAVTGGDGADTFVTGGGADTIGAAAGNDTITSGAGADSITGGTGNDSIIAGDGADEVVAGAGNNIVDGGAGNDTISATTGEDSLVGGAGDDTFSLAANNVTTADTIKGGADTDTISYSAAGAVGDDDFTNITGIEELTGAFDIDYTLSTKAAAAGISKITFAGDATAESDTIALDANFTNDLTVVLDDDSNVAAGSIVATNYTKSLTVQATDIQLDTRVSTLTGGTGSDTLEITSTTNNSAGNAGTTTVDDTDLGQLTNFETIKLLGSDAVGLTLANGNAADGVTLTVDASGFTGAATINAQADTDGKIVIQGGTGNDTIQGSSSDNGDSITGGTGDDSIKFGADDLTLIDTVDGGTGSNSLVMSEALNSTTALVDEDFTNVTNVQTLTSDAGLEILATLGSEAQDAGITAVTFAQATSGAGHDELTVSSTFTANLTVNIDDDADANSIVATAYTGNLTVAGTETSFEGHEDLTVTGGTGTDTLLISAIAGTDLIEDEDLVTVTNVEKITFVDSTGVTGTAAIELHDNNATYTSATSYQTITVDTTGITGAADVNAVAELDAKVVINTGAAADTITASKSANLGDSLTAGDGNDTFEFAYDHLTSADTVSGGAGDDTIKLMTAGSVADTAFTNVTSVKTLTTHTSIAMGASLGSNAYAAGITTVDFVDNDADDIVTVEAGFTGPLTVNFDADSHGNKVDATNYTGSLTITATDAMLDEGTTTAAKLSTITGGSGTDTLQITASAAGDSIAIIAGDLAQVTYVDNITFSEASGVTGIAEFAIHNNNAGYTHASDYHSLTIDSSAISGASTIDLSAETDSKVILTTGAVADTVTTTKSANFGDSISTGLGNDTVIIHNGHLTSIDTLTGGGGDDILKNADALTLLDAAFTNVTGFKTIQSAADKKLVLTLGAEAAEAGIDTINLLDDAIAVDTITLEAGFTNDVTIDLDDDGTVANKIDATSYTKALTVTAADADITDGTVISTITGGSGSDTLKVTMSSTPIAITATHLAQVTKIDKFEITNNLATSLTISDNNVVGTSTSSDTLTIDATALTSAAATIDASAEDDGRVVINTGGGGDTITGSTSANYGDSITSLAGTDTISTGAGADTVDAGAGNDTITGGAGADSLTGGADSDTFIYTAVSQSNSSATDTLVDFTTGADKLAVTLDYSSIVGATTVNATLVTAAAGVTAVQNSLSAERGQYIYDTTNSALYVNVNNDNLITSLDYKINSSTTNSSGVAFADGDVDFTITTAGGIDTITSGGGDDSITAGAGADSITAGGGDDTIIGGTGADTIAGGAGANTFVINAVDQTTTLTAYTNDSTNVSGADVITGIDGGTLQILNAGSVFVASAGGTASSGFTSTSTTLGDNVLDSAINTSALADNEISIIRGTFNGTKFTAGTGNTDLDYLVAIDTDVSYDSGTAEDDHAFFILDDFGATAPVATLTLASGGINLALT